MSLIKCKECGHQVSDMATACPSCGMPIDKSPEKKKKAGCLIQIIFIIILLIPIFFLIEKNTDKSIPGSSSIEVIENNKKKGSSVKLSLEDFTKRLESKLGIANQWPCDFNIDKYEKDNIVLSITYHEMPAIYEVQSHTDIIARKALETLIEQGRDPHGEWLSLSVWARKPEKGVTGKSLVRIFGRTHYDFNTDSLVWKPYK